MSESHRVVLKNDRHIDVQQCEDDSSCLKGSCVKEASDGGYEFVGAGYCSGWECGEKRAVRYCDIGAHEVRSVRVDEVSRVCLADDQFENLRSSACLDDTRVYHKTSSGAVIEVGECLSNTRCEDEVCTLLPVSERDFYGATFLEPLYDSSVDMEIVEQLVSGYGVSLYSADEESIWTPDEIESIYDTCAKLPLWWCENIVFVREVNNPTASAAVHTGVVYIGGRADSLAIVHELVHIHRSMYGQDVTTADYSVNDVFYYDDPYDDDFSIYAEFMAAAGWSYTVDEDGNPEALVLMRNNKPVVMDVEDVDEFIARASEYADSLDLIYDARFYGLGATDSEIYGIAGQITEHLPRLAEYYYMNSLEMKHYYPALHDFYSTHFFDGREYFLGECGHEQISEVGGVRIVQWMDGCEE